MALWLNRFQAVGAQNGTTSHVLDWSSSFTATAGRVLYLVGGGGVTFSTPSGWTLVSSAVGNTGLYVFKKTAAGGETSATVTHNGSNFPIEWVVYEFPSGTTDVGTPGTSTGVIPTSWATATGLTGTYTVMGCATIANGGPGCTVTPGGSWLADVDAFALGTGADSAYLAVLYQDGLTGTSATPSGTLTQAGGGTNGERVTFALSIPAGGNTQTAAAALSVTANLAAAATDTIPAAAALAATASLTASATTTKPAAAALSANASLTAGAVDTIPAAAALAVTASLSASATDTITAAAALAVVATLSASSADLINAALAVTASLSAGATDTHAPAAALAAAAALSAGATHTIPAAAALAVVVALSAGSASTELAGAALAVVAALAVTAVAGGTATPGRLYGSVASAGALTATTTTRGRLSGSTR